jgi:hypothetical protein
MIGDEEKSCTLCRKPVLGVLRFCRDHAVRQGHPVVKCCHCEMPCVGELCVYHKQAHGGVLSPFDQELLDYNARASQRHSDNINKTLSLTHIPPPPAPPSTPSSTTCSPPLQAILESMPVPANRAQRIEQLERLYQAEVHRAQWVLHSQASQARHVSSAV